MTGHFSATHRQQITQVSGTPQLLPQASCGISAVWAFLRRQQARGVDFEEEHIPLATLRHYVVECEASGGGLRENLARLFEELEERWRR